MLRRVRIHGRSMLPTLAEGQTLWVEQWTYRFRAPRRGEIVVATQPGLAHRIIKRVTGVPGDRVAGRTLPADAYWLTGDNAQESTDSATRGAFHRSQLRGRLLARRG